VGLRELKDGVGADRGMKPGLIGGNDGILERTQSPNVREYDGSTTTRACPVPGFGSYLRRKGEWSRFQY
jgi:hypothetical protein